MNKWDKRAISAKIRRMNSKELKEIKRMLKDTYNRANNASYTYSNSHDHEWEI